MSKPIRVPLTIFDQPVVGTCHKRPVCRRYARLWLVAQAARPLDERSHSEAHLGVEVGQVAVTSGQPLTAFHWSRGKVARFLSEITSAGFADMEVRGAGRCRTYLISIRNFEGTHLPADVLRDSRGNVSGHTPDLFGGR